MTNKRKRRLLIGVRSDEMEGAGSDEMEGAGSDALEGHGNVNTVIPLRKPGISFPRF